MPAAGMPVKAGEDNPQAREEEGKLSLLSMESNTSLTGIPEMWGSEFQSEMGKPSLSPAEMLAVDLDLIHHNLGNACEAMPYTCTAF